MAIIIIISIFITLKILELLYPLRQPKKSWIQRSLINVFMAVLVFVTAFLIISPVSQFIIDWGRQHQFGLLYWLSLPTWASFIMGFLLMDLTFYYWHRLNHQIPLLWRFHNVHHTDPDLDVTTAFRFHFVEIAYSGIFRIFQLGIIGIAPFTFIIYEICFQANTFFHHSNLKLPERFERKLNYFLVTPRMHGIHHSQYQSETNSNYSVIFTFWDRIHKSLQLDIPQQHINIGIPAYQQIQDNQLRNLLLQPFRRQRLYWKIKTKTFDKRS